MPAMNLARHRLSNALEQRGIHFGWVMVALAFVNASNRFILLEMMNISRRTISIITCG
jgi:hypothetical protein